MPLTILTTLQEQLATWLRADDVFSAPPAVPVLESRTGDLLQRVKIAVGKAGGLAVVVGVPLVTPGGKGGLSIRAQVPIHIWENVTRNMGSTGHRIPAADAAVNALAALHYKEVPGGWSPLVLEGLREAESYGTILCVELVMQTEITLRVV